MISLGVTRDNSAAIDRTQFRGYDGEPRVARQIQVADALSNQFYSGISNNALNDAKAAIQATEAYATATTDPGKKSAFVQSFLEPIYTLSPELQLKILKLFPPSLFSQLDFQRLSQLTLGDFTKDKRQIMSVLSNPELAINVFHLSKHSQSGFETLRRNDPKKVLANIVELVHSVSKSTETGYIDLHPEQCKDLAAILDSSNRMAAFEVLFSLGKNFEESCDPENIPKSLMEYYKKTLLILSSGSVINRIYIDKAYPYVFDINTEFQAEEMEKPSGFNLAAGSLKHAMDSSAVFKMVVSEIIKTGKYDQTAIPVGKEREFTQPWDTSYDDYNSSFPAGYKPLFELALSACVTEEDDPQPVGTLCNPYLAKCLMANPASLAKIIYSALEPQRGFNVETRNKQMTQDEKNQAIVAQRLLSCLASSIVENGLEKIEFPPHDDLAPLDIANFTYSRAYAPSIFKPLLNVGRMIGLKWADVKTWNDVYIFLQKKQQSSQK